MKIINDYFNACEEIKKAFLKKYYKGIEDDCHWVADRIGEILFINDHFYDMEFMVDALSLNVPVKKMFEYKDYEIKELENKKIPINFINWLKLTN